MTVFGTAGVDVDKRRATTCAAVRCECGVKECEKRKREILSAQDREQLKVKEN